MLTQTFIMAIVLAVVNTRSTKHVQKTYNYFEDSSNIIQDDREDMLSEQTFESVYPTDLKMKREVHEVINGNLDGSLNVYATVPLTGDTNNLLSATGSVTGVKPGGAFRSTGEGLSYGHVNNVGATFGLAHTPLFQKTDVSAMGNLNLFKDRSSSFGFNAGASRSFSPFIPRSSREPSLGLIYSRYF